MVKRKKQTEGFGAGWYKYAFTAVFVFFGYTFINRQSFGLSAPNVARPLPSQQQLSREQVAQVAAYDPPGHEDALKRIKVLEDQLAGRIVSETSSRDRLETSQRRAQEQLTTASDFLTTFGGSKCRKPKVKSPGCDGYGPVLHPSDFGNYEDFVSHVVDGLKKNCAMVKKMSMATALELTDMSQIGGNNWWLEFGSASGYTARLTKARLKKMGVHPQDQRLHSFDCFQGLPERWMKGFGSGYAPGAFTQKGKPPFMDELVAWEIGYFNDTLPLFVRSNFNVNSHVAYLHVDPDLYSSAHTIFTELGQYIGHETLVPFHELVNFPKYKEGEMLALWEWFSGPHGQCIEMMGGPAGDKIALNFECNIRSPDYNCHPNKQGSEDSLIRILAKGEAGAGGKPQNE